MSIVSEIDPTKLSLDGLLVQYNELATALGVPTRNAKFRDKPTGVKAVRGLMVQAQATEDLDEDPVPPGRQRLLDSGKAEELRQDVLAGQRAAIANVAASRPTTDPFETPTRDLPPANEADPKPVAPAQRGPKSKAPADTAVLEVLVDNPKREPNRKARFEGYGTAGVKGSKGTVAQYVAHVGDRRTALKDIVRDIRKGYIKVV